MNYYRLKINKEENPSFIGGFFETRSGKVAFLYELKEGAYAKISSHLDALLACLPFNHLETNISAICLVYTRSKYTGSWSSVRPTVEPQDAQSLHFLGFDPDDLRATLNSIDLLEQLDICLPNLLNEDDKKESLVSIASLWDSASTLVEFKQKVRLWAEEPVE